MTDRWDIIVSSAEIRKLLIRRSELLKVSLRKLVEEEGVYWAVFKKHYLENHDPVETSVVNAQLIFNIARKMGLTIKLTVYVDKQNG